MNVGSVNSIVTCVTSNCYVIGRLCGRGCCWLSGLIKGIIREIYLLALKMFRSIGNLFSSKSKEKTESKPIPQPQPQPLPQPKPIPQPEPQPKSVSSPKSEPKKVEIEPLPSVPKPITIEKSNLAVLLKSYVPTQKLREIPKEQEYPKFEPLTSKQVAELLETEPKLATLMVAQEKIIAKESIQTIHDKSLPIEDGVGKDETQKQMQFILYSIQNSPVNQRSQQLLTVADCLKDCAKVSQGYISKLFKKIAYRSDFDEQINQFLDIIKENLIEGILDELFPAMKQFDYAKKTYNTPKDQFPHIKNGFIFECGDELGFKLAGAIDDPNANKELAKKYRTVFLEKFNQYFTLETILKKFIIAINEDDANPSGLNEDGTKKPSLTNLTFMEWWGDGDATWMEQIKEIDLSYEEGLPVLDYSPLPNEAQHLSHAYITEPIAIKVFERLGYIHKTT